MSDDTSFLDALHALNSELALALGEAIWAFSMVERQTYKYLRNLSSEPLDELMADQPFKVRIRLIRHLVDRLEGQEEAKARAVRYLDEAEKLAVTRNLLAHNPWQVWINFEQSAFKSAVKKITNEKKSIELEKVREFRDAAGELASNLEELLGGLRYP